MSSRLFRVLNKPSTINTEHFHGQSPSRYVKKYRFWKNCDSAEKGLKGPYLEKPEMASYLARCPNLCTNCLGWMPFLPFSDF